MLRVLVFLLGVFLIACVWIALKHPDRESAIRQAKKYAPALLIAAVLTAGLLWFSMNSTGKIL